MPNRDLVLLNRFMVLIDPFRMFGLLTRLRLTKKLRGKFPRYLCRTRQDLCVGQRVKVRRNIIELRTAWLKELGWCGLTSMLGIAN